MVRTGLVPSMNKVVVGVMDLTQPRREVLRERYGPGIKVEDDVPAVADACTDDHNCWPPMGGIEIMPSFNINRWCTSAFVARIQSTGQKVLITAGHCIWANKGSDEQLEHDNHNIGKAKDWVFEDEATADVGIIGMYNTVQDQFLHPAFNRFMRGPSVPTIGTLVGTVAGEQQAEGFLVCRMGRTSHKDCGMIVKELSKNESCAKNVNNVEKCWDIRKTIELNFDSTGGDSGGSVYSNSEVGQESGIGYGLHVHSDPDPPAAIPDGQLTRRSWYSPLNWARQTLIDYDGVTINWCLDANC